jgi:hypothetical protein
MVYDNTNLHESTTAGLKFNSFLIGNNLTQLINDQQELPGIKQQF